MVHRPFTVRSSSDTLPRFLLPYLDHSDDTSGKRQSPMPQASTPWMALFFVYYSLYRSMDWYAVHGVIDMASQSQPATCSCPLWPHRPPTASSVLILERATPTSTPLSSWVSQLSRSVSRYPAVPRLYAMERSICGPSVPEPVFILLTQIYFHGASPSPIPHHPIHHNIQRPSTPSHAVRISPSPLPTITNHHI